MWTLKICLFVSTILILGSLVFCQDDEDPEKWKPKRMEKPKDDGKWKKKSVLSYNEGDLDKLYDQWEVSFGLLACTILIGCKL